MLPEPAGDGAGPGAGAGAGGGVHCWQLTGQCSRMPLDVAQAPCASHAAQDWPQGFSVLSSQPEGAAAAGGGAPFGQHTLLTRPEETLRHAECPRTWWEAEIKHQPSWRWLDWLPASRPEEACI